MIRERLVEQGVGSRVDFRWRSHEISRIEGLSDAVFAFAVALGGHGEVRLPNGNVEAMVEGNQLATLMVIFGVGYVSIFAVFILLHLHAYRKRVSLALNELELFDTRNSIQENALNCGVGLL